VLKKLAESCEDSIFAFAVEYRVSPDDVLNSSLTFVRQIGFWFITDLVQVCLECFDAVGWVAGRASGL